MTHKMHNEETNNAGREAPPHCDRATELVAYLYGEANEVEAKSFRQHLNVCVACGDELAAFGVVREAVGEWRAAALSGAPEMLALDKTITPVPATNLVVRKRSALAALREFFTLSPRWLQAGTVAATLVVCALAVFSVSRTEVRWDSNGITFQMGVRGGTVQERVAAPPPDGFSPSQVDKMTARHASEINDLRNQLKQKEASLLLVQGELASRKNAEAPRTVTASVKSAPRGAHPNPRAPLAQPRDQQLAADTDDEYSPRLYDLLRDVN